jgi:5'-phosphate synthase pdxT subunit
LTVGVLALQGDVREHISLVEDLGEKALAVRTESDLLEVSALIIPGGESTTISKLLTAFELMEAVRSFAKHKPTLGTCAGLILLSDEVVGGLPDQQLVGGIPIRLARNAYGGQTHSFEAEVEFATKSERVAFIRAPRILDSARVEVIATLDGLPVAVRHGQLFGASFHPELTGASFLHSLLLDAAYRN